MRNHLVHRMLERTAGPLRLLTVAIVTLGLGSVSFGAFGCSETKSDPAAVEKPSETACAEACGRSMELHYEHVLGGARARANGDPKAEKEHVEKAKAEWEQMKKSGREKKNVAACVAGCLKEGTKAEIDCMRTAKTISAVKDCKKP